MTNTTKKKLDNFRNMCGMVGDYDREYSRWPTTKEFVEKLDMETRTVQRYKREILQQSKEKLLETFNYDIIIHVKNSFNTINENIKVFKKIRDKSNNNSEKMEAAKNVLEAHLDAIRLIYDVPEYLGVENNNVSKNEKEYNIKKTETTKINHAIDFTFD
jgi:hypothetical protein